MRIGIDARFAVHPRRGIGNYVQQLLHHLAELDHENRYFLYVDADDREHALPEQANFTIRKFVPANYATWEQILLPLRAKQDHIEVLHCTGNTAPALLPRRIGLVVTIHDVMYLKEPSLLPRSTSRYQRLGRIYRRMIVPRVVNRVSAVIAVSRFSKREIAACLPSLKDRNVVVIHEAGKDAYRPLDRSYAAREIQKRHGISGPYVLSLGGMDPRKNTRFLVDSFLELKEQHATAARLLVVGVPKSQQRMFAGPARAARHHGRIVFLDFVSEDDLLLLYNGATVFVYPSLFEGFGLPPLEAMACGTPVISSNTASLPEVVGDAAVLIDPTDGDSLKTALSAVLHDPHLREELSRRGFSRVRQFSWHKTAAQTRALYQSVRREGA